jgi:hypothetical protein
MIGEDLFYLGKKYEGLNLFISRKNLPELFFFCRLFISFSGTIAFQSEVKDELILIHQISNLDFNLGEKALITRIPIDFLNQIALEFEKCLKKISPGLDLKILNLQISLNHEISGNTNSSSSKWRTESGFSSKSRESRDLANWMHHRRSPNNIPKNLTDIAAKELVQGMNQNIEYLLTGQI